MLHEMKYPSWRNKLRQDAIFSMRLLEAQYFSPWSLAVGSFVSEFSCQWIWYRKKVHTLVCDAQQRLQQQQLWYLGWLSNGFKSRGEIFSEKELSMAIDLIIVLVLKNIPWLTAQLPHASPFSRTHSKRTVAIYLAHVDVTYVNTFLHSSNNLITMYQVRA